MPSLPIAFIPLLAALGSLHAVEEIKDSLLLGLQGGPFQLASVTAAWLRGDPDGWFAQIAPGISSGRISVGFGSGGEISIHGNKYDGGVLIPTIGYAFKASYVKTWWPKANRLPSESLIGLEVEGIMALGVTVGFYRAIPDGRGKGDYKLNVEVGIGF
jgi:hypothetical protein